MTTRTGNNNKQTEQERRSHFTFFRSFQEAIDQCEEKDQLPLYRGIVNYALDGKEPVFDNPILKLAWTLIKPNLYNGWIKSMNGRQSSGVPKPTMKGNQNAKKQNGNKAKSKLNQSNRIGMDRNGMDNVTKVTEKDIEESVSLSPEYQNFLNWLSDNCKNLLSMEIPTEEEFNKLLKTAGNKKVLTDKLLAMENDKKVPKEKRSIYITCLKWLKNDNKD